MIFGRTISELTFYFPVEHRVGRITGRLPQELADQIVENVLELFGLDRYVLEYTVCMV